MYCADCGTQNNDTSKICRSCGVSLAADNSAAITGAAPVQAGTVPPGQKASVFSRLSAPARKGIIIGAAVIVVAALLLAVFSANIGSHAALQRYIDAQLSFDTEAIADLMPPDEYERRLSGSLARGYTEKEFREQVFNRSNCWHPASDYAKMSGDWSSFYTDYSIDDSHKASRSELNELNRFLSENYEYKNKVTAAVAYKVTVNYESRDKVSSDGPYDEFIMCMQIDGRWYIIDNLSYWFIGSVLVQTDRLDWFMDWVDSHYNYSSLSR